MSRVKRVFPDLPFITASTNTKIIVTDADNYALGYTHINTLINTIDSGGLATDGANIFNGNQIFKKIDDKCSIAFDSLIDCSNWLGVHKVSVSRVLCGERKTIKGWKVILL
jgi:hypothetical protein